jgi:hypothetical protein
MAACGRSDPAIAPESSPPQDSEPSGRAAIPGRQPRAARPSSSRFTACLTASAGNGSPSASWWIRQISCPPCSSILCTTSLMRVTRLASAGRGFLLGLQTDGCHRLDWDTMTRSRGGHHSGTPERGMRHSIIVTTSRIGRLRGPTTWGRIASSSRHRQAAEEHRSARASRLYPRHERTVVGHRLRSRPSDGICSVT